MRTALVVCLVLHSVIAHAGGGSRIGNGGDTIYCAPSSENAFSGYYTLDYLLEYRDQGASAELAPVQGWDESSRRLLGLIQKLYPEVYPHLHEFVSLIQNTTDLSAPRVWVERELGLEDIKDEAITRKLPGNCLDLRAGTQVPQLTQTVIRRMDFPYIRYEFDPRVLSRQKRDNPLQYSFFMIHEWLWDITDQVDSVRKINWLLHSKQVESMAPQEFQRYFRSFGLFDRKLEACQKSQAIQAGLARLFPGATCEELSIDRLRAVTSLDLSGLPKPYPFRVGDFYGFDALESLDLSGTAGLLGLTYPEFFSPLFSLRALKLEGCELARLPASLMRGLKYLKVLNLSVMTPTLFSTDQDALELPQRLQRLYLDFSPGESGRKAQVLERIRKARPGLEIISP